MTVFWLIRHGQTDWNSAGRWQGQADVPLNQRGREQVKVLAERLQKQSFDAVYSSDLRRAYDTAAAFAVPKGMPIIREPRLREICIGEWEGLQLEEIISRFPEEWADYHRDANWQSPPGGETLLELAKRASEVVNTIILKHPDAEVALVAHKIVLSCIIVLATDKKLSRVWDMELEPATPVMIEINRKLVPPVK